MSEELDFALKQNHYLDDTGLEKDPGRVQPRTRELLQLIDHKAGLRARSGLYFECLPIDRQGDPQQAEIVKAAIKWELTHPEKFYEDTFETVYLGAACARMWAAALDFYPEIGPYGEILPREVDGRNIMWAPGYRNPHHPACPRFIEIARMPLAAIQAMAKSAERPWGWNVPDDLRPDDGYQELKPRGPALDGTPGMVSLQADPQPGPPGDPDDELATVMKLWERGVGDGAMRERRRGYREVKPEARRMECQTCDYESEPQGSGPLLPEMMPGSCPECGGDLERIDAKVKLKPMARERLTILLPIQRAELAYGEWPHRLSVLPYMVFVGKPHPAEPIGQSETSENWTMQLASDMSIRLGLEHMQLAKPYHMIPRHGVEDARGEPWQFGDWQGLGIFYTGDMPPQGVHTLQANGLPPAWGILDQRIEARFQANMGRTDIGLSPAQSRDIAVGTLRQLIESGEVPMDHQIQRFRRAQTPFLNALYQLIRATYTPERLRRMQLGPEAWGMALVSGKDLPAYDVVVTAEPTLAQISAAELDNLVRFASAPPPMRRFLAETFNIPASRIAAYEQAEREWQEEQRRQQMETELALAEAGARSPQGAGRMGQRTALGMIPPRTGQGGAGGVNGANGAPVR